MPQSLVRLIVHLVFSTHKRVPWIDGDIRGALHAYMAGILERERCREILIGGTADHVHIVAVLQKDVAPIKTVEVLKKRSSAWMKQQDTRYQDFYWQAGYALFSVSPSNLHAVRDYVSGQAAHHQKMTFQDELRILLKRHGLTLDERYAWD